MERAAARRHPAGGFFTLIGLYPFAERWANGDERIHHLLDRPRNAPTRTGIGAAAVVWYINLLAAGGNDVIADKFQIPLFWTTWFFRVGFFVGPIAAFIIARRVCLYLQRRELQIREEGVESGLISLTPDGAFEERHEQPSEEREAVVRTRQPGELVAPTRTTSSRCRPRTAPARRCGPAPTASTSTTSPSRTVAARATSAGAPPRTARAADGGSSAHGEGARRKSAGRLLFAVSESSGALGRRRERRLGLLRRLRRRVVQVERGPHGADPRYGLEVVPGRGQDVAHSSEPPTHGSSTSTFSPRRQVRRTFHRNANVDAPRMNAPIEDTKFSVANFSG